MRNYLGIKGIEFIWHGEWADPEIVYGGESFSEPEISGGLAEDVAEGIKEGIYSEGYTIEDLARDDPSYIINYMNDCYWALKEAQG